MKFVLHRHITDNEHYDLMIDTGGILPTWRIPLDSLGPLLRGDEIRCQKIHGHRRDYLDTSQPISCSAGRVELTDSGPCAIINSKDDDYTLQINGSVLSGIFIIEADSIKRG